MSEPFLCFLGFLCGNGRNVFVVAGCMCFPPRFFWVGCVVVVPFPSVSLVLLGLVTVCEDCGLVGCYPPYWVVGLR